MDHREILLQILMQKTGVGPGFKECPGGCWCGWPLSHRRSRGGVPPYSGISLRAAPGWLLTFPIYGWVDYKLAEILGKARKEIAADPISYVVPYLCVYHMLRSTLCRADSIPCQIIV